MKYESFLGHRKSTFRETLKWINDNKNSKRTFTIVELGTSRSFKSWGISDNEKDWFPNNPERWAWSDGFFTRFMADNLEGSNFIIYTIDPCNKAIKVVKTACGHIPQVKILQTTSTEFLKNFNEKIDLLYMDHLESGPEACQVHLDDSKLVIEKDLMNDKSIILIDDTPIMNGLNNSKGHLSIPYLKSQGYETILHEYQLLLSKGD